MMELTIKQQIEVVEAAELSADCPYDLAVEFLDWGIHFGIYEKTIKRPVATMTCRSAELALTCARTMKKLAEDAVAALKNESAADGFGGTGEEVCHE